MTSSGIVSIYIVEFPNKTGVHCDWEDLKALNLPEGTKITKVSKNLYGYITEEKEISIEDGKPIDEDAEIEI